MLQRTVVLYEFTAKLARGAKFTAGHMSANSRQQQHATGTNSQTTRQTRYCSCGVAQMV